MGGAYYTHNAMVRALEHIVKDTDPIATRATQRCAGLLGSRRRNDDDDSDTVGDLLIVSIRANQSCLVHLVNF